MDMMNECGCGLDKVVDFPICGQSVKVDVSALNLLSEERVKELIREALLNNPGGGLVPDLQIGVESLWPLRRGGKQVYAKVVDFGSLPNTGYKYVDHGIENVETITVNYSNSYVTDTNKYWGPSFAGSGPGNWLTGVSSEQIHMWAGNNRTNLKAMITLLYTKTTDPVIS